MEDNPGDLVLLKEYLGYGSGHYQFLTARSGEEGVALAEQHRPDLAVIDVRLRGDGIDGYETCRRIKDMFPMVKVLMLTGGADALNESKAMEAGADHFCLKNFDYQFMAHLIREMFDAG
ncbi:MAG: response regulator [Candidatus Omnitrophota bacterium]